MSTTVTNTTENMAVTKQQEEEQLDYSRYPKTCTIVSRDDTRYEFSTEVVGKMSGMLRDLIKDNEGESELVLPLYFEVASDRNVAIVKEYIEHYNDNTPTTIPEPLTDDLYNHLNDFDKQLLTKISPDANMNKQICEIYGKTLFTEDHLAKVKTVIDKLESLSTVQETIRSIDDGRKAREEAKTRHEEHKKDYEERRKKVENCINYVGIHDHEARAKNEEERIKEKETGETSLHLIGVYEGLFETEEAEEAALDAEEAEIEKTEQQLEDEQHAFMEKENKQDLNLTNPIYPRVYTVYLWAKSVYKSEYIADVERLQFLRDIITWSEKESQASPENTSDDSTKDVLAYTIRVANELLSELKESEYTETLTRLQENNTHIVQCLVLANTLQIQGLTNLVGASIAVLTKDLNPMEHRGYFGLRDDQTYEYHQTIDEENAILEANYGKDD